MPCQESAHFQQRRSNRILESYFVRCSRKIGGFGGVCGERRVFGCAKIAVEKCAKAWETSHMTTIAKADKSRLTIRGIRDGLEYLVRQEGARWTVEAAPQPTPGNRRELAHATRDLSDHLNELEAEGFKFEPAQKEKVPPCRF